MLNNVRVIVEPASSNLEMRMYHIRARISDYRIEVFEFPLTTDDEEGLANVGLIGESIVKHLDTVEGVDTIFVKPYSFSIVMAGAYDWKDIEADIFYAIEIALGKPVNVVG